MSSNTIASKSWQSLSWKGWGYAIMLCAYSFLAYKLITFNQYDALSEQWNNMPATQFWWLTGVFFLLPINWLLEAIKWQMLTARLQALTLKKAYKAVLAGISTGFFTPNRVGEMVGRMLFLNAENRKAGATLSIVNSLTQNLVMTLCGIPTAWLFFSKGKQTFDANISDFLAVIGFCFVGFVGFYFALPWISKRIAGSKFSLKINSFSSCLITHTWIDLSRIIVISILRYAVFFTQFYLMLRFWNVNITLLQGLIAIPVTYLFVTFTPSVAFSEAAVRSSYAVLIIGVFSNNVVGITLAGITIWAINFVVPMMLGSVVMVYPKSSEANYLKH